MREVRSAAAGGFARRAMMLVIAPQFSQPPWNGRHRRAFPAPPRR
ncbi:MAG TPA: hypothetical protein VE996_10120 [Terriglobales bacterium]|nr:hypothetical protein [Terriglobales bacterium]